MKWNVAIQWVLIQITIPNYVKNITVLRKLLSGIVTTLIRTDVSAVMLVRSSPTVCMTRRPHSHRPSAMPTPPKTRIARGVSARACAPPSEYSSHRATRGPIALLRGHVKSKHYQLPLPIKICKSDINFCANKNNYMINSSRVIAL